MATQMNFGPKQSYPLAKANESVVDHAQTNFDGGATTKQGGTNKQRQKNFEGDYGVPGSKTMGSLYGEKRGTGSQGGY